MRAAVEAERRAGAPAAAERDFRPEIQGLRAVAVLLVVVYHLWPGRLTGGFVGVDVFFVLSGYLITAHLVREATATGRIRLGAFWARRVRRLLPVSFVVLLASLALTLWAVPRTLWDAAFRGIAASALYVQNWALAADAVDYSATTQAGPAQHFWSLSVEEQFYLAWPLLLLAALWAVGRRAGSGAPAIRRAVAAALALVAAASLAGSVAFTAYSPAEAYFATPVRAWEFAAGGLVALLPARWRPRGPAAVAAGWAGLAAVLAAAVAYHEGTAFPGAAALLPVAGTALAIACMPAGGPVGPFHWLAARPATWVGDVSYGTYLWHWPLIVVAPYVLRDAWAWPTKLLVLAASLLLAWASLHWVENPFRRGAALRPTRRAFAFAAAGMAAVVAACLVVPAAAPSARPGDGRADTAAGCYGPAALARPESCGGVAGDAAPDPGPELVAAEAREHPYIHCQTPASEPANAPCDVRRGSGAGVALIGDSYAVRWLPALERVAAERDWSLTASTRSRCAPSTAPVAPTGDARTDAENRLCTDSVRAAVDAWASDPAIDLVVFASSQTKRSFLPDPAAGIGAAPTDGYTAAWDRLAAAGKKVVVLAETPRMEQEAPTCLALHADDPGACSVPRERAWPYTRHLTEALGAGPTGAVRVDPTPWFCDASRCHAQIGGVIVFSDAGHVSRTYAAALAPRLGAALDRALGGAPATRGT